MPFTPFHFGPGLLVKGLTPRLFSWSAFVVTQILIDCETLYFMLRHQYPIHRALHTFLGATLVGLATAVAILFFKWFLQLIAPRLPHALAMRWPSLRSESSIVGVLTGGIIGGASHPLLDGLMHHDIQPFAPWTSTNPFLGTVGLIPLHIGCLIAGLIGLALVRIWISREDRIG
jgi:membrane-bound metal-dependent hydrolase YbcI (DUF457 family)